MGDVLALTRLADPVALDRPGQDHGGLPLVLDRRLVGRKHLDGIVASQRQLLQLLVGQVRHHLQEPRVRAPEVVADVGARFDGVLLILTVHHLAHALDQEAVGVLVEQRVPLGAPDHLQHVPAGAAEDGLELLDDLAVAADGTVEPLQVAVDHEDQVVQLLARRQRDGAERLGLVGLAVADERPHLCVRGFLQPAIFQVAHEARLVDGADRTEPHRDRGELPEVGHQPRMRIGRQAAALFQLAAEVLELLGREPALEKRTRIDARGGVTLEVDDVAVERIALALEEVVEADLIERGGRRKGGNVSADAVFGLVGLDHHRQRVPSHQALDPPLDFAAAWERRLLGWWDGVDVGRVGRERQLHAALPRVVAQLPQEAAHADGTTRLQHVVERLEPFAGFQGFNLGAVDRGCVPHASHLFYYSAPRDGTCFTPAAEAFG